MALVNLKASAGFYATTQKTGADNIVQSDPLDGSTSFNGVPSDATILYHTQLTVPNGSTSALDLNGSLMDALGQNADYAKVYGIFIKNLNAVSGDTLTIGGNSGTFVNWVADASDILNLGPKGSFFLMSPLDGYAVVATSGDTLKLGAPGSHDIIVYIAILGK